MYEDGKGRLDTPEVKEPNAELALSIDASIVCRKPVITFDQVAETNGVVYAPHSMFNMFHGILANTLRTNALVSR